MQSGVNKYGVPDYTIRHLNESKHKYMVLIPVINEGDKLINQLKGMSTIQTGCDIVLVDGGSTDNSTHSDTLSSLGVHAVLRCQKGLSRQMRAGFNYALEHGYLGVVTIDGNGKDSWWSIPKFVELLKAGYGHIQGSRHAPGGIEENTPKDRAFALKYIHAPLVSLAAGFRYTDTTNGFRGYSADLLRDHRVDVFRDIFVTYNLHYYLAIRAPKLGYRTIETPVERRYPASGKTPTKISGFRGKALIMIQLMSATLGFYNP
jgi:dolichol-phosphate mannosyltransferase